MRTVSLAASALAAPVRPIRFDHLSLEQGLSQSTVQDILQDRRGYIWLATEDGLNRYDGLSFKVYKRDPADPASLPSSFVWDVEEDADGNLWVATASGLAKWEQSTDRFVRQEALAGKNIRVLRFATQQNALWIGTRDAGLLRLDVAGRELDPLRARRGRFREASPTTASTLSTSTARAGCGSAPTAASTASSREAMPSPISRTSPPIRRASARTRCACCARTRRERSGSAPPAAA